MPGFDAAEAGPTPCGRLTSTPLRQARHLQVQRGPYFYVAGIVRSDELVDASKVLAGCVHFASTKVCGPADVRYVAVVLLQRDPLVAPDWVVCRDVLRRLRHFRCASVWPLEATPRPCKSSYLYSTVSHVYSRITQSC